jgi:hypothetical protein
MTNPCGKLYKKEEKGMKRTILTLAAIMALVGVLVAPMAVMGADTTEITGTTAAPDLTTIDPTSGVRGNTYTLVSISGTDLTGASSVTLTGAAATITATEIVVAVGGLSLTCTIAIPADAPVIPVRDVVVVTPDGTDTIPIAFTVEDSSFAMSAPADFSLDDMSRTVANIAQSAGGTVTTTAQNWQITATGFASNGGYMYNAIALSSPTAKFQIGKNGTDWTYADGTLNYDEADTPSFPFWVQQIIDSNDPAGTYTITITFTGSPQ